jgi:hypothetical protein
MHCAERKLIDGVNLVAWRDSDPRLVRGVE